MNKKRFWSIVDATRLDPPSRARDVDLGERNRRYRAALAELTPEEILDFRRRLEERLIEAYRWDLWAAAILILDGCTASSFRDFRAWLVAQGRETFEAALRDPETLADNAELKVSDGATYSAFMSIPWEVYRHNAGHDMPELGPAHPAQPAGEKMAEEPIELAGRFPRLYRAFFRDHWEEESAEPEYNFPPPLKVAVPPMAEDRFWALIDGSRQKARKKKLRPGEDFIDAHIQEHTKVLRRLSPEELIAYDVRFWDYHSLAYRWDLWAVAYWLHAGCSDDGFIDFRSCLISLGREWFFQVLNDPDSLTDLIDRPDFPFMQAEGFQYLAGKVYTEKTGYDAMPDMPGERYGPSKPKGRRIDHDNDELMRKRFPKLVARFPDMGDL